jgi:hypothetical protein
LFIPSNIAITFDAGVIIQATSLSQIDPFGSLITIRDAENITIHGNGAIFRMNKEEYTGEHNHCFNISGSKNIVIEKVNVKDSGGDGFYIGRYESVNAYCENITITNSISENNRRQGMSVIAVDGLLVDNCQFIGTIGTNPEAGVDIEPNDSLEPLKRVVFRHCLAKNNAGRGFNVFLKSTTAASPPVDVTFDNCKAEGNTYGFATVYAVDGGQGKITFNNCIAENAKLSGFLEISCSANGVQKVYNDCTAINCNENGSTSQTLSFSSSFLINDETANPRAAIGNSIYRNCKSIDTRGTGKIARGFGVVSPAGAIPNNIKFFECVSEGHTVSPFEFATTADNMVTVNTPQLKYSVTSTASITNRYSGYEVNNAGATGFVRCNLPIAKEWLTFKFKVEAAQSMKITPQLGAKIFTTSATDKSLQSNVVGDTITVKGRADGNWEILNLFGNWVEV